MTPDIASIWIWLSFSVFIIIALGSDTFLLSKKHIHIHDSMQVALIWSLVWISSAFIFNFLLWLYLYHAYNPLIANKVALDFLTGYLIEKSLSIDNLFAFYLIFDQFRIPSAYQHRVFSYGIWSAIVFRLILILLGSWLISHFHWLLYLMGGFLFLTGIKMFFASSQTHDLLASRLFNWLKKQIRMTDEFDGQRFFIKKYLPVSTNNTQSTNLLPKPIYYATPLFIALIFIEISDLIFAFDSIPAIFAITTDPFIVWSSNIFAILGLRALYFLLAGMVARFHLLKYAIALILIFVGFKMLVEPWITISVGFSLSIISLILILFTWLSLKINSRSVFK